MARVGFFVKDELLRKVDAEAAESRINRGALIQAALVEYLETHQREREEARTRGDMEEACRAVDSLAEKLGSWDPARIIREFRDHPALSAPAPRKRLRTASRKRRS